MSLALASQILLWVLLLALSVVVLSLARQIGVLHERIAPLGALRVDEGPAVGSMAPNVAAYLLNGERFDVVNSIPAGSARLLLFVSANCLLCRKVVPLAKSVASAEGLQLVFVGDATPSEQQALVERDNLEKYPFVNGPELGVAFAVGKLPYGVLLDDRGKIVAKGLVNTREHLESLVTAHSTGFGSVQDYVAHRNRDRKDAQ